MDQDSAHMMAASKVPMLKPSEFEIWRMRIKQYIQMIDYAPWEVIENGATLPKTQVWKFGKIFAPSSEMLDQTFDRLQKLVNLDTMSMDDLYYNLKAYEPEVKGMSSSNSNTQNMAILSSTNSSTNGVVNTTQAVNTTNEVYTASTQVNVAFSTNIENLSDAVICAFRASQPNSP
uniref:Ribonuclease H-like domain-containing protein n=1 Tax=Tanacetum cinerariifolium TaxID=118510 RepID=A0A699KK27_TANCI|nr:ribonuclease H-like domain-containing protein [Tanacetum cinerariifolium]